MSSVKVYWVHFERQSMPSFLNLSVGVTARSEGDVRVIVATAFAEGRITSVKVVEDVATLDQGHVLPNMGNIFRRGMVSDWL